MIVCDYLSVGRIVCCLLITLISNRRAGKEVAFSMSRDLSLDILRGIMLIIMATDHFGEPVFQHIYEFAGYVSAAEGFVFLSGMLVALVYGRYHAAGANVMERRVWKRAGVIYLYHMVVLIAVFVFTMATVWSGADWQSFATEMQVEPVRALISGMLLSYQAPMLDILPLYVILMLCAPLALRWMAQYQGMGIFMVILGSVSLWGAAQYGLGHQLLGVIPDALLLRTGAFDLMAWQLLFVLGMVLGFARMDSKATAPRLNAWLMTASIGMVVYLFLQRHGYIAHDASALVAWLQEFRHIARDNMAWLRVLNFLAFVYVIAGVIVLQHRYGVLNWLAAPARWLAFLGQHSLQVFAYHLVVLYCYIPFRWGELAFSDNQKWVVLVVFLASLTLPAWWHARYLQARKANKIQPRRTDFTPALGVSGLAAVSG
ncbi:MAG: OpgC protein [Pseudomonadota bacterium]|jgi:hypothetical protein